MVWYYISRFYYVELNLTHNILHDIYGNRITDINISDFGYRPFIRELKYRYSGRLYDKLKHLLSYIYRNINYLSTFGPNKIYSVVYRIYTNKKAPVYIGIREGYSTANIVDRPVVVPFNFLEVH